MDLICVRIHSVILICSKVSLLSNLLMLKESVRLCNCKVMMGLFFNFLLIFVWLQNTVSWVLIMGLWWIQNLIGVEELMERNGGVVRMWCLTRSTVKGTCTEVEIVQESLWKHLKLTLLWQQSLVASHTPNHPQRHNLKFQVQTLSPFHILTHQVPHQGASVSPIALLLIIGRKIGQVMLTTSCRFLPRPQCPLEPLLPLQLPLR